MLVLKYVLIRFNAENDLSHVAVLTTIVKAICSTFFNVGKAASRGKIILKHLAQKPGHDPQEFVWQAGIRYVTTLYLVHSKTL